MGRGGEWGPQGADFTQFTVFVFICICVFIYLCLYLLVLLCAVTCVHWRKYSSKFFDLLMMILMMMLMMILMILMMMLILAAVWPSEQPHPHPWTSPRRVSSHQCRWAMLSQYEIITIAIIYPDVTTTIIRIQHNNDNDQRPRRLSAPCTPAPPGSAPPSPAHRPPGCKQSCTMSEISELYLSENFLSPRKI